MQISTVIKRHFKTAFLLFLLGGAGVTLVFSAPWDDPPMQVIRNITYNGVLWIVLWFGNGYINNKLGSYLSWLDAPVKSLFIALGATLVFTVVSAVLVFAFFRYIYIGAGLMNTLSAISSSFIWNVCLITLVVALFLYGRSFLLEWKETIVEKERLRQENLVSRFEALKSQVDPHFLFNSLNVLSSLVYKNQDQAARFIKHLSEVYRYVLDVREREVVSLEEELRVLEAYIFLLKTRFGEGLHIEIDPKLDRQKWVIAPLTLQLLVENAVKHNIISRNRPLRIELLQKDEELMVNNNLQKKDAVKESAGLGLKNIQNRYHYLSNRKIRIENNETHFQVFVPLLTIKEKIQQAS